VRKAAPPVGELLSLTGKIALITGASAGIGKGVARRLSEAGATVAVHYRGGREAALAGVEAIRKSRSPTSVLCRNLSRRAAVAPGVKLPDFVRDAVLPTRYKVSRPKERLTQAGPIVRSSLRYHPNLQWAKLAQRSAGGRRQMAALASTRITAAHRRVPSGARRIGREA
jgi:hypothetical protein